MISVLVNVEGIGPSAKQKDIRETADRQSQSLPEEADIWQLKKDG